jgi:hypothetical protein
VPVTAPAHAGPGEHPLQIDREGAEPGQHTVVHVPDEFRARSDRRGDATGDENRGHQAVDVRDSRGEVPGIGHAAEDLAEDDQQDQRLEEGERDEPSVDDDASQSPPGEHRELDRRTGGTPGCGCF